MRRLKHLLEYAILRVFAFLFSFIPWSVVPYLARALAALVPIALMRRTRLVKKNMRIAFPEWNERQLNEAAVEFWRRLMSMILEGLRVLHNGKPWVQKNVTVEGKEVLEAALKEGKGVLLHSGHLGNWEMCGTAIALAGFPLAVVGRIQKNLLVDEWLGKYRASMGLTIFNHHQAVRETQRWLRQNGCLAILGDHNLYKGGIFVNFFGRPAASTTLTALLHMKIGSPIVGIYCYRKNGIPRLRFENLDLKVSAPITDRTAYVSALTQRLTDVIEEWIRRDPPNWLWGHNRWKRQPES